jgi:hypothetical protein
MQEPEQQARSHTRSPSEAVFWPKRLSASTPTAPLEKNGEPECAAALRAKEQLTT